MCQWTLESVSLVALDARLGCLDENLPVNSEPCQMIQTLQDAVDATYKLEMSFQLYQTSNTTSFLLYFLARNPEKQERLRQEIDRILPSILTPIVHLDELRYLKACVQQESLRLAPVTIDIGRTSTKDAILSGYRIPKGTIVMCNLQVMSPLEKFPKPDAFIPELWVQGRFRKPGISIQDIAFRVRDACLYWPSPGRTGNVLLVIKIQQNFRIEFHNPDLGMELRLVNTPDQPLRF